MMGPVVWRVVDWAGFEAGLVLYCVVGGLCWVDVVMGPVVWRVVDWAGFEAGLVLWRNALRTAVGVFVGGGRWRCDPSREGRV
ncbi:hypothetical protein H7I77_10060 [Mycolicibacterium novocastrense]|uniref:Uncharacterized protein n=1 Tax=Mycolicibacterium novocastrense TaxID=59813 RepID=A0AAW5SJE6_MYCNV|nr:hypothetical protein [Mycolicibacterium novocastrense]MCV7023690.1 hypothetical protein [Mycolicibacterium novocastrense]